MDATKHTLAKYLMELTIVDYDMVHVAPSEIAAAALCLSMKIIDKSNWVRTFGVVMWKKSEFTNLFGFVFQSETLSFYSQYTESELLPVMKKMAILIQKSGAGKLTAIHTKFKSSKFMRISAIPELKSDTVSDLAGACL